MTPDQTLLEAFKIAHSTGASIGSILELLAEAWIQGRSTAIETGRPPKPALNPYGTMADRQRSLEL